jgi:hypothetical protein
MKADKTSNLSLYILRFRQRPIVKARKGNISPSNRRLQIGIGPSLQI